MPREYMHMQKYGKEIGETLGFTHKQVHNFIGRYNVNQRKFVAGIALKEKGRQPKDFVVREDAKIKRLEMEAELMRDFLSHTEGK